MDSATGNAPTITHQDWCRWWNHGDLCSCGAIESQPVPEEPAIDVPDEVSDYINRVNLFIRNLQSALKLAQEDARDSALESLGYLRDKEKAEAALQRAQEKAVDDCKLWRDRRDEALTALEKAEAINRRMVELLKECQGYLEPMVQLEICDKIDELLKEVEK